MVHDSLSHGEDIEMQDVMTIDVRRVVFSLSDALDLVGVDELLHGKRVGMMAAQLAHRLGESPERQAMIYDAGLLHDCGVSSTREHRCLVQSLDWAGSQAHCDRGRVLLHECSLLAELADCIAVHHTHWTADPIPGISDDARRVGNLIYLVDRVDALAAPSYADRSTLREREAIRATIAAHSGSYFSPELVAAFMDLSAAEAFWLQLDPAHVRYDMADRATETEPRSVTRAQLKELALLFARIVDAKSPFTTEHSEGVARLAAYMGRRFGLDSDACYRLELAGLLHDIGKLRIPDEILEKPGSLTDAERTVMISHSFETFQILRRTPGLDEIAELAAYHHERLHGLGYPFHRSAGAITQEMRILQVADVFQALAQRRPYRKPMALNQILAELGRLVDDDSLDGDVVADVERDAEACLAVAQCASDR